MAEDEIYKYLQSAYPDYIIVWRDDPTKGDEASGFDDDENIEVEFSDGSKEMLKKWRWGWSGIDFELYKNDSGYVMPQNHKQDAEFWANEYRTIREQTNLPVIYIEHKKRNRGVSYQSLNNNQTDLGSYLNRLPPPKKGKIDSIEQKLATNPNTPIYFISIDDVGKKWYVARITPMVLADILDHQDPEWAYNKNPVRRQPRAEKNYSVYWKYFANINPSSPVKFSTLFNANGLPITPAFQRVEPIDRYTTALLQRKEGLTPNYYIGWGMKYNDIVISNQEYLSKSGISHQDKTILRAFMKEDEKHISRNPL